MTAGVGTDRRREDEACEGYVGLLVRAADGSLGHEDRARLDTHLLTCDSCRAALETQRTAHLALADAFDVDAPLGFSTRVLANLEPEPSWFDRLDFRRWTWRVSPVAAALMIAAWMVAASSQTTAASPSVEVVDAAATTTEAEAVLLTDVLEDGDLVSLVWDAEVRGATAASVDEETVQ